MRGIEAAAQGRLTRDAEMRTTKRGKPMAIAHVAVDDDAEATTWVRVAVFSNKAEALSGRLRKGDRVYIESTLRLDVFEGRDGQARASLKVNAWQVEPLGAIGKHRPPRPKAQRNMAAAVALQAGPRLGVEAGLDDPIDDIGRDDGPLDHWPF